MSLNLVSPGVKVREVDLTIGNISGAQELVGAIAGPFEKGPIDVPLLIENEQDLLATYGKPLDKDGQFEYWMTASSYLSYGGVLRVLRSDNSSLRNAGVGTVTGTGPKGDDGVQIKSYDDYTEYHTSGAGWFFAAKNPGTWGNGLKVFTIDHFADQVITVSAGISTTVKVGMGVTQAITGRNLVGPGTVTTYAEGFMRGIITGVGINGGPGIKSDQITVKVVDRVDFATKAATKTNYDQLQFFPSSSETTPTTTTIAVGTTTGNIDTPFDITITGITTTNVGTGTDSIQVGDLITTATGPSVVAAGTTVVAIGASTITVDKAITGISSLTSFTFTRSSTTSTTVNTNQLFISNSNGDRVQSITETSVKDWYNSQTLGLSKGGDIPWNSIAEKPGTSEYAANRESESDELHVVVVDEDGSATGVAGNIVEKFLYLSKAKDGKRQPSEEVYYKNYLANISEFIYAGVAPTRAVGGTTAQGTAVIVDEKVNAITITDAGSGYQSPPAITISAPGGSGTRATAVATVSSGGIVDSITITDKGSGYSSAPDVTISAPVGGVVASSLKAKDGDNDIVDFDEIGSGNWGANAAGTVFDVQGNKSHSFQGGKDYSTRADGLGGTTDDGYQIDKGDVINSYNILRNPAEYEINFILQGPSGGGTIFDAQAKASSLIAIAEIRKDCIACISPHRSGVVNVANSDTQTDNIVDFYASLQSSSYAVFDSGYKYTFDRFNNEFRYIPLNGDIGGLMARTAINSFSWFSPAGASRGAINGAIKLAYNPTQAQRDIIYPKRINPVIASPGAGIILFGDRTGLGVASAFDRINVRRLFLTLEDVIERAARDQLFEFNDVITRTNFLNIVDPFLRDVKAKRGITDFVVICDETNNTPAVIDANQFKADIFIKPARSINFIGLTFVATRTGVSFEEVVGNV